MEWVMDSWNGFRVLGCATGSWNGLWGHGMGYGLMEGTTGSPGTSVLRILVRSPWSTSLVLSVVALHASEQLVREHRRTATKASQSGYRAAYWVPNSTPSRPRSLPVSLIVAVTCFAVERDDSGGWLLV
ncbi:hypothetical protein NMY22_g15439 [Coprinellus aureogranulatus]|nr:hypothetical protein NMY22_g15439 [Coprinellus aureogranulatus]